MNSESSCLHAVMTHPSMVDYPGKMAVLFFTQGCNFRCGFCHNTSLMPIEQDVKNYSWGKLKELCDRYRKEWVHAATITGGEPTLQANLEETVDFLKAEGFQIKLDTNGSNPEMLKRLLPKLDYVAMDIKCGPSKYQEFVHYGTLNRIKESIGLLINGTTDYEFRTTLMEELPGIHTDEDLLEAAEMVKGAKLWIFQPFVPHENLPEEQFRTMTRTRPSVLKHAAELVAPYVKSAEVRGQ